jgi:zinc and cadmium transporter
MNVWINTIIGVLIVSLISLIGVFFISFKRETLRKILLFLVSFSTGALLGDAFIHLLPEAIDRFGFRSATSLAVLFGLLLFFVLEKFISWRHCHIPTSTGHPHPLGLMTLVGDGVHNFIDGMVIAGSFLMSRQVGITTLLAVIFHEIPQEIGDFGVLIYSGYSKSKALLFNFMIALTSFLGAILILIWGSQINGISGWLLPFTAGGFIYIAGSDLIPELHKETSPKKSLMQFAGLILGIAIMLVLK